MIVVDTKDVALAIIFCGIILFSTTKVIVAVVDDNTGVAAVWFVALVVQVALVFTVALS